MKSPCIASLTPCLISMVFLAAVRTEERPQEVVGHSYRPRRKEFGEQVLRVHFDEKGRPQRFDDFLTGFLADDGTAFWARLCGLAVASDGSLLVGDDTNGVIYRVSYRKPG